MIMPAAGWCGQATCEARDVRLGHEEWTQREGMK